MQIVIQNFMYVVFLLNYKFFIILKMNYCFQMFWPSSQNEEAPSEPTSDPVSNYSYEPGPMPAQSAPAASPVMYDPEANIPSNKKRKKAEDDDPFAEFELEPTIKPTKLVGSQPTRILKEGQK